MRRTYIFLFFALVLSALFSQCSDKGKEATSFNEKVVGYTSGQVSRGASVLLLLSSDVDESVYKESDLSKFMTISPAVNGKFSFSDAHTIVFKPSEDMAYDTEYEVTADLGELFDDESGKFSFKFKTHPFKLNVGFDDFSVDDLSYYYKFTVRTLDEESLETVKSAVSVSGVSAESVNWEEKSRQQFQLTVKVRPGGAGVLTLSSVERDDLGLSAETLITEKVPDNASLSVFDVSFVSSDTKYIQAVFNKPLDPTQNLMGLAYIEDNTSQAVEVDGNKLKLFPDNNQQKETVDVFLSQSIRAKNGMRLGKNITKSVDLKIELPLCEFIGDGVIIPQTEKLIVPFRAIYLKGVHVTVYKIFANNIASWLQNDELNSCEGLRLFGRPVAVTTFFMDEASNLTQWRNYAVDLSNLVKVEPGCMYRVELKMDKRLTAWPCAESAKIDKSLFEQEDKLKLAELNESFDTGDTYYYMSDDWSDYVWEESKDPCTSSYYVGKTIGKNVFATNIGLLALSSKADKLMVVATDLVTAKAVSDVDIEVYNRQNQLIGKSQTDGDGQAQFSFDGNLGAPFVVMAKKGTDVSGLRVKRGAELSTSTFDVSGEVIQKGLKGYIYGERGVWRPGDTLFLSFMLNDREKTLPENHPVVFELSNPLGNTYKTMTRTEGKLGLYTFVVPTEASVPTGSWLATVKVGSVSFSKRLRIESIKPNRLKINLSLPDELSAGTQYCNLRSEWLNGGTSHDQRYEVVANIVKGSTSFDKWKGYQFDDITRTFESKEEEVAKGSTNSSGGASVSFNMPRLTEAPGKLRCSITTRLYEASGEFSTDVQMVTYSPYSRYVGIKLPTNEKGYLPTGSDQTIELAAVTEDGRAASSVALTVEVSKLQWYWWWRCDSYSLASYASSSYEKPLITRKLYTASDGKANLSLNFKNSEWGNYLIKVKDAVGGHTSSVVAYFDWPDMSGARGENGRENVVTLSIQTDKDEYKPGENIRVSLPTAEGTRAVVSLANSAGIVDSKFVECVGGQTDVSFPVTKEMTPNVYVCATLIQKYEHTTNDMPIRLYGVKSVAVNSDETILKPVIVSKDEVRPLSQYEVKVKEENGRPMAYTLAIVDEGLLDLTRFKTPNAWNAFFAKEALGLRMWDLYGLVCGSFGGKIDQMFSIGGDESLYNGPKAIVNRFTPMVYFGGPFVVEKGKTNTHKIDIPNYNGRVRVMVVAADGSAYGSAEKSVFVKKPLMLTGTMPRQIGVGDEMTVAGTIFALENNVGRVKTKISVSGDLQIIGEDEISTEFSGTGDESVLFRVRAGKNAGQGTITLTSTSSSDKAVYSSDIAIRSVSQRLSKFNIFEVKAGGKSSESLSAPGNERQSISLEMSLVKPLNASGRVDELLSSAYSSAERIASTALSQLYLSEFSQLTDDQKKTIEQDVKNAIEKLAAYQTNEGGIALWPNSGFTERWISAYVLMFLNEASNKGYFVNDNMKKNLRKYVQTQVRNWKSGASGYETHTIAFSLYVLASSNQSNTQELGTMNRMKESVANMIENDQCLLSAAYSLVGRKDVAKQLLNQKGNGVYYWSTPDVSRVIAHSLANMSDAGEVAENLRSILASDAYMSSCEVGMAFHAMNVYYKKFGKSDEMNFTLRVDGKEVAKVKEKANVWSSPIASGKSGCKADVENKGKSVLYGACSSEGWAVQSDVNATESNIRVRVAYKDLNGNLIDSRSIAQGTTFKAVVTVDNISGKLLENLAVTHILPSGVEVLSAQNDKAISYQDVRDDRVLSYIDVLERGASVSMTLSLSATYAGNYYVPAIVAEGMYNNTLFSNTNSGQMEVRSY